MSSAKEAPPFVSWEEFVISSERGRRAVNYYVKDCHGRRDLAVVGREKNEKHMSYVLSNHFFRMHSSSSSCGIGFGRRKWKSRREVLDWLSEIVSDSFTPEPSLLGNGFSDSEDAMPRDGSTSQDISSGKMTLHSKEFSWLGSAWHCRKRRKHYRSFSRNKITISVHDFVHIMSEEGKRLVAYVEDLYEDLKANKMVAVQWFHKLDEVSVVLPVNVNDREIFFSLCLQELRVECIDGLAAVLSSQDFDKFQNEARHGLGTLDPYLCRRLIDQDDIKPYDITQVQGYWSQEVLRSMYTTPGTSLKLRLKITHRGLSSSSDRDEDVDPKNKKQRLNDDVKATGAIRDEHKSRSLITVGSKGQKRVPGVAASDMLRKQLFKQKLKQQQKQLTKGCQVEVLSQDSGMRGCWFRCVVLKIHCDKLKVQYRDVLDADTTSNLEEWVLASRVATPDKLGIRLCGRSVVRPDPSQNSKLSRSLIVGSVVDAWWHNCWWEGIITEKASEEEVRVYFPGEEKDSMFTLSDLRPSHDWVDKKWKHIKDRPDVARLFSSDADKENIPHFPINGNMPVQTSASKKDLEERSVQPGTEAVVPNLVRELDGLQWNRCRKRNQLREFVKNPKFKREGADGEFLVPKSSSTVDHEICKIGGDKLFAPPLALCSNLVLSQ